MIDEMISQVKQYLPLEISEIDWNGREFQIYGLKWKFFTLSAWRICDKDKMVLGCYDENTRQLICNLKGTNIIDIGIQTNSLKIDPVFILSNDQRIEIFSITLCDSWALNVHGLEFIGLT